MFHDIDFLQTEIVMKIVSVAHGLLSELCFTVSIGLTEVIE